MSPPQNWNPAAAWRRFRLEAEGAREYPLAFASGVEPPRRNPLFEGLFPTLLHIKAVAILDDALIAWLDRNGHQPPKRYRNDLHGRLSYCDDLQILDNASALQDVRDRRNDFAHEPGVHCDWATLVTDVAEIERGLIHLELAKPTGKLECFLEHGAQKNSAEPGVIAVQRVVFGVREDGATALTIVWTCKLLSDSTHR